MKKKILHFKNQYFINSQVVINSLKNFHDKRQRYKTHKHDFIYLDMTES